VLSYALAIFSGAFLLFQVQPLIGKYILPWFGGGPGVWTTCVLFFQLLLLAGYAYAHFTSRWLRPRSQAILHLALLVGALAFLPITPSDSWKPRGDENPTLQILALLCVSLGLPYFVLSSTGPLMQQWFSRENPGASPYRLYALSNVGSLLALLSYPFYFETHFTRKAQAVFWGWGLAVYAVCAGVCAVRLLKSVEGRVSRVEGENQRIEGRESQSSSASVLSPATLHTPPSAPSTLCYFLWLLLPACASALLLATTNKICQDVAVIPFLWVLPLALYLLTFIICFDSPRWYVRLPFTLALIAAMSGLYWVLTEGSDASIFKQVGIYCGSLFICCMVCHGELYRLKPHPIHLTAFYLMIAAGGALGGLFVAVIAPLIFTGYYELQWSLIFCGVLFVVVGLAQKIESRDERYWHWLAGVLPLLAFGGMDWYVTHLSGKFTNVPRSAIISLHIVLWMALLLAALWFLRQRFRAFRYWRALAAIWLLLGVCGLAIGFWIDVRDSRSEKIYTSRNFYGVLTVYEHRRDDPQEHHYLLQHGRITHGLQFIDRERAAWPTTYYGETSGIALAMHAFPAGSRRVGLVGLGTATLTAFGQSGDYFHIYEINPQVRTLAMTRFRYATNCPGKVDIAMGDARLSMERDRPQQFDLLALDAFSSDAIPVHLLTKEAFDVYQRHLKTNSIIVVHISNHYLDLEPVVTNLAKQFGYKMAIIDYDENDEEWWLYSSTWILLSRDQNLLEQPAIKSATKSTFSKRKVPLWTDDFTSLFQILKK
jgi:spermidine synthase